MGSRVGGNALPAIEADSRTTIFTARRNWGARRL